MEKIKLIVVDDDTYYLNNLMNYITTEYKNLIDAVSFSNKEIFLDYIKKEKDIDIFLVSKNFYDSFIEEIDLRKTILLSDNNVTENKTESIYKYQSIDRICKEIIEIHSRYNTVDYESIEECKTVTFYSPIGGIGTTTLAISTAMRLSQIGNRVLYLNLERIQSNGIFMPENKSKYNFSDLIISVKEGGEDFNEILSEGVMKYNNLNFYYFNPTDSILDLEDISLDDIKDLLGNIINANKFNYIVIDLPSVLDSKYYYIFEKSLENIIIMGQDIISSYKVDTILRQLDDISNFKFVFNMYDDFKEKKISKLISANLLPIISTVKLDQEIRGEVDIEKLLNINDLFRNGIIMIVNKLI